MQIRLLKMLQNILLGFVTRLVLKTWQTFLSKCTATVLLKIIITSDIFVDRYCRVVAGDNRAYKDHNNQALSTQFSEIQFLGAVFVHSERLCTTCMSTTGTVIMRQFWRRQGPILLACGSHSRVLTSLHCGPADFFSIGSSCCKINLTRWKMFQVVDTDYK